MDMTTLEALETILRLGWPAIVLIMLAVIWRRYVARTDELIDVLREVAGLRTTLRMDQREGNSNLTDSDVEAVRSWRAEYGPKSAKELR